MKLSLRALCGASVVACTALAGSANADVVYDFNSLVHGEIVTDQFEPELRITGSNPNRSFDIIAGFDTTRTGTLDPDLQGPSWASGNLAAERSVLGTVLIISENRTDRNNNGILDNPSDEGRRPAGSMTLEFARPVSKFGFDVVDIEDMVQELSFIEFFLDGVKVGEFQLSSLSDSNSIFYDPTVVFGDNSANHIAPVTAAQIGSVFDTVRINVGGSSGWDNFVVPAPGTVVLAGLGGLATARRRRR